jgi:hypothetical protein
VRGGLHSFLCISAFLTNVSSAAPVSKHWYPEWNHIYYHDQEVRGQLKMHAVLSDNAWNHGMGYVSTARLTSKSKESRVRWEVRVKGGAVVIGDLHVLAKNSLIQKPPNPPRPTRLTPVEMVDIGNALKGLLTI